MALTSKQEAFCRGVVIEKLSYSDAYRAAYDVAKMSQESIQTEAKKLAASPPVASRLEVIRGRTEAAAIKKAVLTLEQSLSEAGSLLEDAQALGQISAGVAAATLRAKLSGHLAEKKDEKPSPLTDMDVASLIKMKAEIQAQLQRNKDALDMVGDLEPPPVKAPVAMRRVIG